MAENMTKYGSNSTRNYDTLQKWLKNKAANVLSTIYDRLQKFRFQITRFHGI